MYQLISVKYCFHSQKCLPILTDIFINWIYIVLVNVLVYFILYIEKQQNKRKNCKTSSENLNIFIQKFSVS